MSKIKSYFYLLVCLFFAALNFNLILKPLNLVTGGTQGLSLLINNITKLSPSLIVLLINITALVISFFFLTMRNTTSALVATFAYPLFIKLSSYIPTLSIINDYKLGFVILAGLVCGLTGGFIYKLGFSSGGITIINLLINKYLHIKISLANFIINTIIIIFGYFYFGLMKAIYSILVIFIGSIIIHKVLKKSM